MRMVVVLGGVLLQYEAGVPSFLGIYYREGGTGR